MLSYVILLYQNRNIIQGGVDFTEDDYEMPEIGEEYQFKDNEQHEVSLF